VYYFTESGKVLLKKLQRLKNRTIEVREQEYAAKIQTPKQAAEEEVTLF
jgi:chemotaxis protein CheD